MANLQKRPNGKWRARYRDEAGRQHARHFARKMDAQAWLDEVTASVVTGQYVDPRAGQETFRAYAEHWRSIQAHRDTTRAHVESMFRRHVYPSLGSKPLASILPSDVQALVTRLDLAPSTVAVIHSLVYGVMKAAVRDRRIAANPCEGTKLPKVTKKKVVPIPTETVLALRDALPAEVRAVVTFVAATGVRQGECFGLTRDRINFLRREVLIDRQLTRAVGEEPRLGPVKTASSVRRIPLPAVASQALSDHLAAYPPGDEGLVFTVDGRAITRSVWGHLWRGPARELGIAPGEGLHVLRHYYASLLIRHGESVKVVQERLGHASATETLDTYSHLWPDSDDRTREAVDEVLLGVVGDSVGTA